MVEMRWPGPYMVKYAFDIDREMAIPLWRLHGPPREAEALRVDFMIFPLPGRSIRFDIEMFTELRTIVTLSAVVALEMTALA